MFVEPVFKAYWSDASEEMIQTNELLGYYVFNESGNIIGTYETRAEAMDAKRQSVFMA